MIMEDGKEIDKKLNQLLYEYQKNGRAQEMKETELLVTQFVEEAYRSMYQQISESLKEFIQNIENNKKLDLIKNLFMSEKSKTHDLKLENQQLQKEYDKITLLLQEAQLENKSLLENNERLVFNDKSLNGKSQSDHSSSSGLSDSSQVIQNMKIEIEENGKNSKKN